MSRNNCRNLRWNEMTTTLLVNLFSAYCEVEDKQFKGYVQPIQGMHYNGCEPKSANGVTLMATVKNYYKGMVKDGIWMKPDFDQESIITLKAQIAAKKKRRQGEQWKTKVPKKVIQARKW